MDGNRYALDWHEQAKKEYDKLDGSSRNLIDKSLNRIEKIGMEAGEALRGNLVGCRKLKHRKAGLRVIFRESEKGIEIVEIIAIGKRSDLEVYKDAEKRI
ncbi:type II toxin-antitoxin system RelE family toxin [Alkalibacterium sp. MB6]|uniref:type II toxin-antitoxin system RelE family toxin n=1 Tax=Alkalibacterium sp. MB6 TaxID=2081965 RepID=UPI00137B7531|nr:type II toxin-antitoxin system RelE/ParE family toxin [Alkalibacterium sp. MB6]